MKKRETLKVSGFTPLEEAIIKDTILNVLEVKPRSISEINLELRRCGFPLMRPDVVKYIRQIKEDGYLDEYRIVP